MARNRPTAEEETDQQGEQRVETAEDIAMGAEVQELKKIEEILTASDVSGGILRLERKGPTDLKWQHVGKMKVEDFDMEHVRKTYGGGDYRAQTYRSSGAFWKRFEFSIDYRHKGTLDVSELPPASGNGAEDSKAILFRADSQARLMAEVQEKASGSQSAMMIAMMTMMQENNRVQIAAMQEASKQQMASMQGMFQAIAGIAKPAPQQDAASMWMPLMLKMIESKGSGGNGSGGGVTEVLETMRQLQEITSNMPQKEEKEEDMWDKMAKVLGPVAAAFVSRAGGGAGGPMIAPAPIPGQVTDQAPTPAQLDPNDPRSYAMAFILNAARKNADPQSYYDFVADNVSDDEYRLLMEALREQNWIDILFEGNLEVHKNRAWFESLRNLFIAPEPEPEPMPTPTTPTGTENGAPVMES
jgi:hypothetical protein